MAKHKIGSQRSNVPFSARTKAGVINDTIFNKRLHTLSIASSGNPDNSKNYVRIKNKVSQQNTTTTQQNINKSRYLAGDPKTSWNI